MYFYASLSSYNYCPLPRWVNMQEWWVNITGIYNQASKGIIMYMKDWVQKLDAFLQFNEEAILKNAGTVTHEVALTLAEKELEKYRIVQDKLFESDFDKAVKKLDAPKTK